MSKKIDLESLDSANAAVLASIVVEPFTPDALRVKILNKLLEGAESDNFFDTIHAEKLDMGECPDCGHLNHWLVPEDELNKRGWVSHENDKRVKNMTTAEDCARWEEACKKKKIIV